MNLDLGFLLNWLLSTTLRQKIKQAEDAGRATLPIEFSFQIGSVKGRIIVDSY